MLHVEAAPACLPSKYIVMDHVDRIADTDLLAIMLRAKEITGKLVIVQWHILCHNGSCDLPVLQEPTLG